jgi:hypothetical protein
MPIKPRSSRWADHSTSMEKIKNSGTLFARKPLVEPCLSESVILELEFMDRNQGLVCIRRIRKRISIQDVAVSYLTVSYCI